MQYMSPAYGGFAHRVSAGGLPSPRHCFASPPSKCLATPLPVETHSLQCVTQSAKCVQGLNAQKTLDCTILHCSLKNFQ